MRDRVWIIGRKGWALSPVCMSAPQVRLLQDVIIGELGLISYNSR